MCFFSQLTVSVVIVILNSCQSMTTMCVFVSIDNEPYGFVIDCGGDFSAKRKKKKEANLEK